MERVRNFIQMSFPKMPHDRIEANMQRADVHYVATDPRDDVVAACFCLPLVFYETKVGGIGGVCVRKDMQGMAVGQRLIGHVVGDRPEMDAFLAWTRSPVFFEKCGFRAFDGIETEAGDSQPMVLWRRDVADARGTGEKWPRVKF